MTLADSDIVARHAVRIVGQGKRDLLFAHGFGCAQTMWRHVAPALARDNRAILFDYIGMGEAPAAAYDPIRHASLDGYARDLLDVARAVGGPPKIVVGHSVSATIGLLAALQAPESIAGVAMLCPSPCFLDDGPYRGGFAREAIEGLLAYLDTNPLEWSRNLAGMVAGDPGRPDVAGELEASFCALDARIARDFARLTFLADNRADFAKLRHPALIVQCAHDAIAGPAVGRYVHDAIPGSRFVELDAHGHCPHLSHPGATIAAIAAFVDELPDG
ncbi:MAG: alpha/beta fold hydrolase [Tagaea sp.]